MSRFVFEEDVVRGIETTGATHEGRYLQLVPQEKKKKKEEKKKRARSAKKDFFFLPSSQRGQL
jgi:hypothetical protein